MYRTGNLSLKRPRNISTMKKVLNYKYSFCEETESLRFFSLNGTLSGIEVNEKSELYGTLKKIFEKRLK